MLMVLGLEHVIIITTELLKQARGYHSPTLQRKPRP